MDVSLALDLVRATYDREYETAIIVSQDWDFGPAVRLAKEITQAQGRSLVFESFSPVGSPRPSGLRRLPRSETLPSKKSLSDLPLRQSTT